MEFLRDLVAGRKRVLMANKVKPINVPITRYITTMRVLALVKQQPRVMQYLPTKDNMKAHHVSRRFLFNVVNTLDPEFFPGVLQ